MKLFKKLLIFNYLFISVFSWNLPDPTAFIKEHPRIAIKSINYLTHKLPTIDTIGHRNLELNDKLIPYILDNNHLTPLDKSQLITGLIRFTQFGDNFGSWILSHYLDTITYLVNNLN